MQLLSMRTQHGSPAPFELICSRYVSSNIPSEEEAGVGATTSGDALYDQAVAIVTRDGRASTSYVQRRLQIGYNRAARLIEQMEEEGIISAPNHSGKREVLAVKQ